MFISRQISYLSSDVSLHRDANSMAGDRIVKLGTIWSYMYGLTRSEKIWCS